MMYKFLSVLLSACLLTGSVGGPLMGYGMNQEIVIEEETTEDTVSGNTVSDNTVSDNTVSDNAAEEPTIEEETSTEEETTVVEETSTESLEAEVLTAEVAVPGLAFLKADAYSNTVRFSLKTTYEPAAITNNTAYFYYREKSASEWSVHTTSIGNYSGSTIIPVSNLAEKTTYEFKIGFATGKEIGDLINPISTEVTTTADDRVLAMKRLDVYSDNAVATLTLSGTQAENQTTYVRFWWREKGSTSGYKYTTNQYKFTKAGDLAVAIPNLKPDTEYEYIYGRTNKLNNLPDSVHTQYTGTFTTHTEDRTATFTNVKPLLRQVKFTVDVEGKNANGTNVVSLFYKNISDSDSYWNVTSFSVDGAEPKTITLSGFKPDTEYEYAIGLGNVNSISSLISAKTGTFKTLKDDRTVVVDKIEPQLNRVNFTLSLQGKATEEEQTEVFVRVSQKDDPQKGTKYVYIFDGSETRKLSLGGFSFNFKQDTEYEYVVGIDEDEERIFATGSFKTLEDDRQIKVVANPKAKEASMIITLSGKAFISDTYYAVNFYFRPKSETEWQKYTINVRGNGSGTITLNSYGGKYMEPGTTYEYWAGIEETIETENGNEVIYAGKTEGEFTTKADVRKLVKANVIAGYTKANVVVNGIGMVGISSTYQLYYREKGITTWQHTNAYGKSLTDEEITVYLNYLKPGTEYEYAVVLGNDSAPVDPEQYEVGDKKLEGTFKTKECDYRLQITQNMQKTTCDTAAFDLQTTGTNNDSVVHVKLYYDFSGSQHWVDVDFLQSAQYKKSILIEELEANETYHFLFADFYIAEDGYFTCVGRQSLEEIAFSVLPRPEMEEITVSKDEVWLNYSSKSELGYGKENITVGVLPENAEDYIYVKYTDTAKVNYDLKGNTLQLSAAGVGETGLVLGDGNSDEVEKSILVHVKYYTMGYPDGSKTVLRDSTFYMAPGTTQSGVGYYDVNNGTPILLEDVKLTNYDEGILDIKKEGNLYSIYAKKRGTAYIEFEKDNVKKKMEIVVSDNNYTYDLLRLTSSNENYPAVEEGEENYVLALADATYTAQVSFVPYLERNASYFNWKSSDSSVATVDTGVIKPLKPGKTTITMTPLYSNYLPASRSFTVEVKGVASAAASDTIPFVTNTKKNPKLKDVSFPEAWGSGWSWKYPETPIHAPVNGDEVFVFDAVRMQEGLYSYPVKVNVRVQTIEKIGFNEVNGKHPNGVLEVEDIENGVNDAIELQVYPENRGGLVGIDVQFTCKKTGITIEPLPNYTYRITAQKPGDYTLTADVFDNMTKKKIMSASYKVKAVKEKQVDRITFTMQEDIFTLKDDNSISINDSKAIGKSFALNAKAYAKDGSILSTPIEWKSSDSKTISVKYDKKNSHMAVFTIKRKGDVTIFATAKDAQKLQNTITVSNAYDEPTMLNNKAKVNLALDYDTYPSDIIGESGCLSAVSSTFSGAYLKKTDDTAESNFGLNIMTRGDTYFFMVKPIVDTVKTGTYKCKLVITTSYNTAFEYPVTISVVNQKPSVSVKTVKKANLFYTEDTAELLVSLPKKTNCSGIQWKDNSESESGFELKKWESENEGKIKLTFRTSYVKTKGNKLADPNVAKGTLSVKVYGYKEPVLLKNVKIGHSYKKPTLRAGEKKISSKTVVPDMGLNTFSFNIYDSFGGMLYKDENGMSSDPASYYDIKTNNPRITTKAENISVRNTYNSTKAKETVEYTLSSYGWREPLKFKLTIKTAKPKLELYKDTLIFNRNHKAKTSVPIYVTNGNSQIYWTGIDCKGANAKAEELLKNDIIKTEKYSDDSYSMKVTFNDAALKKLGDQIKDGTYTFKVAPYYKNPDTGKIVKYGSLTLKIKIVSKDVSVKVTPKGTLDIYRTQNDYDKNDYRLNLQMKISDIGEYSYIRNAKLVGGYADYFELKRTYSSDDYPYYLVISDKGLGKVKSGHTYNLQIEYTLDTNTDDGYTFKAKSNVIKVKAKDTKPKIKLEPQSVIFYERKGTSVTKDIKMTIPEGYTLDSVEGYLDVNKDGQNDICVTKNGSKALKVQVMDYKFLNVTDSGKTYTVPITFKFVGRDGIAKDPVVNLKVKVKR